MIKRLFLSTIITLLIAFNLNAGEVRGAWLAWAGNDIPSKEEISEAMRLLSENNFNTVYVDVWRFGWPYFRSNVFHEETGHYTDPLLEEGRDVMADMIAEGHRYGLNVDAWFEAGFQACAGNNLAMFNEHPEWFAEKRNGNTTFEANGGVQYKWLSHVNRDAQEFLIQFVLDAVRRYDLDGVEFDRVRYPDLDCGYDSATVELYKSEHNGQEPPGDIDAASWIRWRADKLNLFMAEMYDSIKAVNPEMHVSNAPLWYGYEQFCQDWPAWINNGWLDTVTPQVYYSSNSSYSFRLNEELKKTNNDTLVYPGISTIANSNETPPSELVKMIETTRNEGLTGHVIWYHARLGDYYETLKNGAYSEKVNVPYRPADWRLPAIIINEDSSAAQQSGSWTTYTTLPGFEDTDCIYATDNEAASITYSAQVPREGWYEVYAWIIYQFAAHQQAPYQLLHSNGAADTVYVNQRKPGHRRWHKVGDVYLQEGEQSFLRLDNHNLADGDILFSDAVMLVNSNRPEDLILTSLQDERRQPNSPTTFELLPAYPNPFNSQINIRYKLDKAETVTLKIYDINGRVVATLAEGKKNPGLHSQRFSGEELASGIYFLRLVTTGRALSQKLVLIK